MIEPLTTYVAAGVDTENEEAGLQSLISRIRKTWPDRPGIGAVKLDVGFFANVIDIGGKGLAFTSDGVGTKALIAQMMNRYDTIGIDCVAMNVNDLLCVGATPLSMVDYIAVRNADPYLLDEISKGLAAGACAARISIPGGEIAQLPDIIADHHGGHAFDLAGSAVGLVDLDKILIGQDIRDGDVVVGIESNGVHSNGVTLARRVLFEQAQYNVHTVLPGLQTSIGEELLRPTHIYVSEALQILEKIPVKALVHITSDGFLNLARVHAPVGFVIEELPPIPPIFAAIQQAGSVPDEEMFRVFNMGVGFCVVVAGEYVEQVISLVHSHGKKAQRIGYAVQDEQRHVVIEPVALIGKGKTFVRSR